MCMRSYDHHILNRPCAVQIGGADGDSCTLSPHHMVFSWDTELLLLPLFVLLISRWLLLLYGNSTRQSAVRLAASLRSTADYWLACHVNQLNGHVACEHVQWETLVVERGWLQLVEEQLSSFRQNRPTALTKQSLFSQFFWVSSVRPSVRPTERRCLSAGFQTPTD